MVSFNKHQGHGVNPPILCAYHRYPWLRGAAGRETAVVIGPSGVIQSIPLGPDSYGVFHFQALARRLTSLEFVEGGVFAVHHLYAIARLLCTLSVDSRGVEVDDSEDAS